MDLKIKKEFWDKIVSGEKQYEFRKLSKGLESGTYKFISSEILQYCTKCEEHTYDKTYGVCEVCKNDKLIWNKKQNYKYYHNAIRFGTAKLRAATLCNQMNKDMSFWYEEGADDNRIDKGTYDFVKENYIDEDIDFIAYQIMEVENEDN